MNQELNLLKSASSEIKSLRSVNALMAARLDMFDKCMILVTGQHGGNIAMTNDLVWEIDQYIHGMETPVKQ